MSRVLRLPAARADVSTLDQSGGFSNTNGLAAAAPYRPAVAPGDHDPMLWTRGTLYALGYFTANPPVGASNWMDPANSFWRYWDPPLGWGKAGTLVRPPKILVIDSTVPLTGLAAVAGDTVVAYIAAIYDAELGAKGVAAATPGVPGAQPFSYMIPRTTAALEGPVGAESYQQTDWTTDPTLYAGGEVLVLSVTDSRITFLPGDSNLAAFLDYTYTQLAPETPVRPGDASYFDGSTTTQVYLARAALDRALLASGAAKFRRYKAVYIQADQNFTPAPDSVADDLVADSPYIGRRLWTPGDADSLRAEILAAVREFWP